MNSQIKNILAPLFITLLILIILEIIATTILPIIGLSGYRIPFNILIVLFLAFKLESVYLPFFILIMQYFHSFFSVEGWEMGTIAGVVVCITISYLKDLVHFTSFLITMVVTQLFQFLWFASVAFLMYLKGIEATLILDKFWRFIPESIMISLIAPLFFAVLDKIWGVRESGVLGDNA